MQKMLWACLYNRYILATDMHLAGQLQVVFDFADAHGASGLLPGQYSLVTQYPRRVFSPQQAEQQLGAVGLQGPREVLFLEPQRG